VAERLESLDDARARLRQAAEKQGAAARRRAQLREGPAVEVELDAGQAGANPL
jgi:hypothetical protein